MKAGHPLSPLDQQLLNAVSMGDDKPCDYAGPSDCGQLGLMGTGRGR